MGLFGIRIDSPSQPYILEAPDGPYLHLFKAKCARCSLALIIVEF